VKTGNEKPDLTLFEEKNVEVGKKIFFNYSNTIVDIL
jgi:hypothetical protein